MIPTDAPAAERAPRAHVVSAPGTLDPAAVRCVAVIPARGGSKGVPGKNRRLVGGVPLVVRAAASCLATDLIDLVVVSTDDQETARLAADAGAGVIDRPAAIAGDTASSESAVLHALEALAGRGIRPEVVLLVQCTSPFIEPADLDRAVALVLADRADAVFSAVETFGFLWRDADESLEPGTGPLVGQNHDAAHRPRRQDRRPHFLETGAFYAMRTSGLLAAGHRFFGRTLMVPVAASSSVEIDTPEELALADALASHLPASARSTSPQPPDPPARDRSGGDLTAWDLPVGQQTPAAIAADTAGPASAGPDPASDGAAIDVDAVITDFDGVHTDDTAQVDQLGVESVRVSRSDGMGVSRLRGAGVPLVIVSTEVNPVVAARGAKLGVEVLQGIEDKPAAVRAWLARTGIDPARTAYLGNDVNDAAAMGLVGWPVAVADARPEILQLARVVLGRRGGDGAVRELCERVLLARRPLVATAP